MFYRNEEERSLRAKQITYRLLNRIISSNFTHVSTNVSSSFNYHSLLLSNFADDILCDCSYFKMKSSSEDFTPIS
jgi:hypothetical protein